MSANAYLGAEAIAQALRDGADVVVTGRAADPSLTVGPALAHFGWAPDDWHRIAGATMAAICSNAAPPWGWITNGSALGPHPAVEERRPHGELACPRKLSPR
jgi:hypothetical protein